MSRRRSPSQSKNGLITTPSIMCGRGVVVVARVRVAEVVAEQRLVPVDVAGGRLGVGVEQQLVRVAAQAVARGRTGRARGSRSAARAAPTAGSSARRSASTSVISTRVSCRASSSKRHSSTRSATSLKSAKLVPLPSNVAPSGYGVPGQTSTRPSRSFVVPSTVPGDPIPSHRPPRTEGVTGHWAAGSTSVLRSPAAG